MIAIYTLTVKERDPVGECNILTPVIFPFYIWFVAQGSGPFIADIGYRENGADVEPHAVAGVGVSADGLLFERFHAHTDVAAGSATCEGTHLLRFSHPTHQLQLF